MTKMDREQVLSLVKELDIQFIRLQFTDILGTLKNVAIPVQQLEAALNRELVFEEPSSGGSSRREEKEMLLDPDPSTFGVFPWRPRSGAVGRLICNICNPDGTPSGSCPRSVLKQAVTEAALSGYSVRVKPEMEFFLFLADEQSRPTTVTHDRAGYLDLAPADLGENARRDIVLALQNMDYEVEASFHEAAPGQHEIVLKAADALLIADQIVTAKYAIRSIAQRHGLYASFMPKPIFGTPGSGMHLHLALFQDDSNVFLDGTDSRHMSETARYFLGGVLQHARGLTAIANPLVNSYKRLNSGFEAPRFISWSEDTGNVLIRVYHRPTTGTWLEIRSPDPCTNPYLAIALVLKAGLEGIKQKIMPPAPVNPDIQQECQAHQLDSLPGCLGEALSELAKDELCRKALGPDIYSRYRQAKETEWNQYRLQVHHWEIEQYLSRF